MADEKNRDEFWRDASIMFYDVSSGEVGLTGGCQSHLLGSMIVGTTGCSEPTPLHNDPAIAHAGTDFLTIQLILSCSQTSDNDEIDRAVQPGDIFIHDLSQSGAEHPDVGARLCIGIDRASIQRLMPNKNIHGLILSRNRPITRILAQYMIGIYNNHADIDENHIPATQEAFITLISSAIKGSQNASFINNNTYKLPIKQRIIDFIHENIENNQLNTKSIIQKFGISRSSLYRLFEREDGVAKFIRDRRLDLTYQLLSDRRTAGIPNKVILYRYGFSDNSRFAYHFKNRFGILPSEVRAIDAPLPPNQHGMTHLNDYLRSLQAIAISK
ncbi:helix-turn-helix domain-containing protein [Brucellaceae bacterium D45D]